MGWTTWWENYLSKNEKTVHIILSDVDDKIELSRVNDSLGMFESEVIEIIPGKYLGQLVKGNSINPLQLINITQNTIYIDIDLKENLESSN